MHQGTPSAAEVKAETVHESDSSPAGASEGGR